METRANYVLIGAFTLVVSIALLLFGLWAAKYSSERSWQRYMIVFDEAVTGLSVGSPVQYNGISVGSIEKLFAKTGWSADSVDLFEVNEAFAVVAMAALHDLKLDPAKVNVHGGACALGHPIGASGARILVTLLGALKKYGKKRGVASLCIGGGEATAMAVEML